MMNRVGKKVLYRFVNLKILWIIIAFLILLVCIPLTDYSFYQAILLDTTAKDFLHLLNCGGGMFLGFAFNFVLIISICVGLVLHSELANKTFFYEKMNGISVIQSIVQRFWVAGIIVAMELVILVFVFTFCSLKNGFDVEFCVVDIILQFACVLLSGLHIAFVTCVAAVILQSGYKAILFSFVRYLVMGFLWGSMGTEIDKSIRIQFFVSDPFYCIQTVFTNDLVMDNYWVILSFVFMSFIINVGISLGVANLVDSRRDY